jgi:hypothetical protein
MLGGEYEGRGICWEGNICCKREYVGREIYAVRGNMFGGKYML